MDKMAMREFLGILETEVDERLSRWKKISHIENGEAVQMSWQFEQAFIIIDLFWNDGDEHVNLETRTPRAYNHYSWSLLKEKTIDRVIDRVMDRVGNFAQIVQHRNIHG